MNFPEKYRYILKRDKNTFDIIITFNTKIYLIALYFTIKVT